MTLRELAEQLAALSDEAGCPLEVVVVCPVNVYYPEAMPIRRMELDLDAQQIRLEVE